MSKISQSVSFTFRVGAQNSGQFGKIAVEISEIETSLPIDPQIEEAKVALNKLWPFVLSAVDKEVDKVQKMVNENNAKV